MPKVKKASSYIHPNSRKAMLLTRQEHRNSRLDRRKEETNLKQKAKLKKLKWFKDNIDTEKKEYTVEETKELAEKYFQRFKEIEQRSEQLSSIKGRHNRDRMTTDYKIKFAIDKEKQEYETSGFEVPDLMKQESFTYFKNWDGDVRYLSIINMATVMSKSDKCK